MLANEQVIDGRGWRSARWSKSANPHVLHPSDHRLRRRVARRLDNLPGWPEQVKTADAENWIGKSTGVRSPSRSMCSMVGRGRRPTGFHHPRRHHLMGVTTSSPWPQSTRWPPAAAAENPALAEFIERMQSGRRRRADIATMEKKGMPTGLRPPPADRRGEAIAGLGRQLRADGLRRRAR